MYFAYFTACNCHNHSSECYYDQKVAEECKSLDIKGNYSGGGVCINCQVRTGLNRFASHCKEDPNILSLG